MPTNNMTFRLAGEAGQGVESSGAGFAKALARGGLHIFGLLDYMSRVRGGLNFFQVRVGEQPLYAHSNDVHLLLPFSQEAVDSFAQQVVPGGGIIYDPSLKVDEAALKARGVQAFPVPIFQIALDAGGERVIANTVAIGAACGIAGYDFKYLAGVIEENFRRKGPDVVALNLKVAEGGYRYAAEHYAASFAWKLQPVDRPPRMVINGNQALAMGALAGGCRFIAAYPMTPATSIIEWFAAHAQRFGVVTKHAEDEIAALGLAIGANFAGVRGMASTSGGGFSLMVEMLGLAGMTEVPVVIVEAQRGGPSTGLPTRTEQSDLLFVLHASQGEFPRIVIAPHTIEECFYAGWRAFNLAEKYQCPVIILTDELLAASLRDVLPEIFDFGSVAIDRGALLTPEQLDRLTDEYKRYAYTESGISPRALPGHPHAVYAVTSDEHDEYGHITDNEEIRHRMMDKRLRKLEGAAQEMRPPVTYGPQEAPLVLFGWGSTYGALREAVDILNQEGVETRLVQPVDIFPFPAEAMAEALAGAQTVIAVELNYTGQGAKLLRLYTGRQVDGHVRKWAGRPLSPQEIVAQVKQEVKP